VVRAEVFSFLKICRVKYDLVFADPPYDLPNINAIPDLIFMAEIMNENGFLILEHSPKQHFENHPFFFENRNYGKVNFSFFRKKNG
jgi:16S rRNA (guanine966-N2)-methyltransferase